MYFAGVDLHKDNLQKIRNCLTENDKTVLRTHTPLLRLIVCLQLRFSVVSWTPICAVTLRLDLDIFNMKWRNSEVAAGYGVMIKRHWSQSAEAHLLLHLHINNNNNNLSRNRQRTNEHSSIQCEALVLPQGSMSCHGLSKCDLNGDWHWNNTAKKTKRKRQTTTT